MPLVQWQENNIVRRRPRTAARRRANCLKQTVREWQVDNRVDSYVDVRQSGAPYHYDRARLGVKVGSRLLGEQCLTVAQEVPDFAREFVTVARLKSQDLARACHLGRPPFNRPHSGAIEVAYAGQFRVPGRTCQLVHRLFQIGTWGELHLPVDSDVRDRLVSHLRASEREESGHGRDERNRNSDSSCHRGEREPTSTQQPGEPG